jgi:hypothetical protein
VGANRTKAFRNAFFKFFKTDAQLRKTKDIKSDYFQLEGIKDIKF